MGNINLTPLTPKELANTDVGQDNPAKRAGNPLFPIPDNAPELSESDAYKYCVDKFNGKADHHYPYYNEQGGILGYVLRWNAVRQKDGKVKKEFRPFVYCEFLDGKRKWCAQGFPLLRPLYNLDKIAKRFSDTVLLCEGEKTTQAAEQLFPGFVVTTTMQGAQSASKTDYSPLCGHPVIISMDNDQAGLQYGKDVYVCLQGLGVNDITFLNTNVFAQYSVLNGQVIQSSRELPQGYDLADALQEGWTSELLLELEQTTEFPLFIDHTGIFSSTNTDDFNTDTEAFQRLAKLSRVEYDRVRKNEAKHLGITLPTLDKEVSSLRTQSSHERNEEHSDIFPIVEPWPESVTAKEILQEISMTFKRFAILPDHADTALPLWVMFTWCVDYVGISPILAISSPEKQCGKTTVLSVLNNLVRKPIAASNVSPAALFRTIELWSPTLLIDEADTFIRESEEMRGIINSGHTRPTAYVLRTVGDDHTPKTFSTWGAKAIALIGNLPDTLHDRSIVIPLRRKLAHERIERLRHLEDHSIFNNLRCKLLRFSNDHAETIKNSRPCFPKSISISDRALDNWEPLLTIAELAGDSWIQKVHQAAQSLSTRNDEVSPIGTELLKDIQGIFEEKYLMKIHTVDLINYLCEDEESPWSTYNFRSQDKKITPRQLGKLLAAYQIRSKNIEIGGTQRKGFEESCFEESWSRYNVSSIPPENAVFAVHPSTSHVSCASADTSYPSTSLSYPSTDHSIRPQNTRKTAQVDGWTANTANVGGYREETENELEWGEI